MDYFLDCIMDSCANSPVYSRVGVLRIRLRNVCDCSCDLSREFICELMRDLFCDFRGACFCKLFVVSRASDVVVLCLICLCILLWIHL